MKEIIARSHCPISYALDFFGDKWTFLIIRDLAFKGKSFYNEFLAGGEGIATNVLSDRLKKLEYLEIVTCEKVKLRQIRKRYTLTQKGKDLIPALIELIIWSFKYDPESEATADFVTAATHDRAKLLKGIMANLEK